MPPDVGALHCTLMVSWSGPDAVIEVGMPGAVVAVSVPVVAVAEEDHVPVPAYVFSSRDVLLDLYLVFCVCFEVVNVVVGRNVG